MSDDDPNIFQVTEQESDNMLTVPAIFANKVYATFTPMGVRLTFSEFVDPRRPPVTRTAAFIGIGEAMALRDILIKHLADYQIIDPATLAVAEKNG